MRSSRRSAKVQSRIPASHRGRSHTVPGRAFRPPLPARSCTNRQLSPSAARLFASAVVAFPISPSSQWSFATHSRNPLLRGLSCTAALLCTPSRVTGVVRDMALPAACAHTGGIDEVRPLLIPRRSPCHRMAEGPAKRIRTRPDFVSATRAIPLSPKIVPHNNIHWTTLQNPCFRRSLGGYLVAIACAISSFTFSIQSGNHPRSSLNLSFDSGGN